MVKEFLARLGSPEDGLIEYNVGDKRIAMAVLLFRVMAIDGKVREAELARYREILDDFLDVTEDEMQLFERMVREESDSEESLTPFTDIVSQMPVATKRKVVSLMRDLSVSDDELHEVEINLMARTAELLGVELKV